MPAPVISASSSILGFRRNEPFEFQPAATNSPTVWAAIGLPAGVSINAGTGKISGAASLAGVYVVTVTATNAEPSTGSREFVIGINSEVAPTAASGDTSAEWDLDVVTRELSRVGASSSVTGALAHWKKDDIFLLRVRFRKNGALVDPDPTALKLVLKEYNDEPAIALGSTFVKTGVGDAAYFDILINLTGDPVKAALSNYQEEKTSAFEAMVELQMEASVTFNGGPQALRISSRTGTVTLDADLVD